MLRRLEVWPKEFRVGEYERRKSDSNLLPLDDRTYLNAAELSIEHKLGMADALIYSTAIEKNAIPLTGDQHLKNLKNVKYVK
ncbi:MAG: PIN domain-containing protein [Candidatus Altiarchaeota archaeon]